MNQIIKRWSMATRASASRKRKFLVALSLLLATAPTLFATELIWALRMGKPAQDLPNIEGGYRTDAIAGVIVDSAGYIYVTGNTAPPAMNWDPSAFVAKISPDGARTLLRREIRGSSSNAIALDGEGNIVIVGGTYGIPDAPTAPPPPSSPSDGRLAAYVAKLNRESLAFVTMTYLDDSYKSEARAVALAPDGKIHVAGVTGSTMFPTTPSAFQKKNDSAPNTSCAYGYNEGFVSALSADGKVLIYSSYLGGSGCDAVNGISVNSDGSVFVVGSTESANFPITSGALQSKPLRVTSTGSFAAAFLTQISPSGNQIAYSSYLGTGSVGATSLARDATGNIFVAFPSEESTLTAGAYATPQGNGFVAKLNSTGTSILYAARVNSSAPDALAVDSLGNLYITGSTQGGLLPVGAIQPSFFGGTCSVYSLSGGLQGFKTCSDAYVTVLNSSGTGVLFSSYLTGRANDGGKAITVDADRNVYVAGFGKLTLGDTNAASNDGSAFLLKLGGNRVPPYFTSDSMANAVDFSSGLPSAGGAAAIFYTSPKGVSDSLKASGYPLPLELAGIQVRVGKTLAPLYAVSDHGGYRQVTFQVPFELADADIQLSENGVSAFVSVGGQLTAPGLAAVSQHADYTPVSSASPADRNEVVIAYGTGLGLVEPSLPSGVPPQPGSIHRIKEKAAVTIGGKPAEVLFAGLTSGFVGLYQVNVRVPEGAMSGPQDLVLSLPPVQSGYDIFLRPIYVRRDSKAVKIWIR